MHAAEHRQCCQERNLVHAGDRHVEMWMVVQETPRAGRTYTTVTRFVSRDSQGLHGTGRQPGANMDVGTYTSISFVAQRTDLRTSLTIVHGVYDRFGQAGQGMPAALNNLMSSCSLVGAYLFPERLPHRRPHSVLKQLLRQQDQGRTLRNHLQQCRAVQGILLVREPCGAVPYRSNSTPLPTPKPPDAKPRNPCPPS